MTGFDYAAPAELFLRSVRRGSGRLVYKRFGTAAAAIKCAVESHSASASVTLEVEGERFEKADIRALYDAANYPLPRDIPVAA